MIWVYLVIVFILLVFIISGSYITLSIIKPRRRSFLETSMTEEEMYPGIMDFYKKSLTSTYQINSRYGYKIQCYFLKHQSSEKRFVVMAHGHTYTHHGCLKYARMMLQKGFNVVLYDERYHGNTGGSFSTLGYYEKDDLNDVISDTFDRFGEDIFLGTYGESMGAATALMEAATDSRVRFIISDCAFSDLYRLVKEIMKNRFHIPVFPFIHFMRPFFRIFTGVNIKGISPIKALNTIDAPILFVHGKDDDYISYVHSKTMYEKYQGKKMLMLAENHALHASSYHADTKRYEQHINEFIERFIIET